MKQRSHAGFTLIELIVVMGIIAVLAAIVIIAVNPARQLAQARNSTRSSDVSTIHKAINQYRTANAGALPPGLTTTPKAICKGPSGCAADAIDFSVLVPTYITDVPRDPVGGTYADTGYSALVSTEGRIMVSASNAELDKGIASNDAAFSPLHLPGLSLWMDASKISGLSNGAAIPTLTDLSGGTSNITQIVASRRPTYHTGALNGKPVMRFDGTDDWLDVTGDNTLGERTYIFVAKTNSTTTRGGVFTHGNNTVGAFYSNYGLNNRPLLYMANGLNHRTWSTNAAVTNGNAHLYEVYIKGSAQADIASATLYIDGQLQGVTGTLQTGAPSAWGDLAVGKAYSGATYYYAGDIAEFVVLKRDLTQQQRNNVLNYSQTKWGTP